jgi:ribosomal protein L34E
MTNPKLPLCPVCGRPMRLENVEERLAKLGVKYKHPLCPYGIVCCGRTLVIENDEEWLEVVRLLKEYHHIE